MTEEEVTIEAARSMMEHGVDSPRRTDLIWKIKVFMNGYGLGHCSPGDLITAMEAAGLKIVHNTSTASTTPSDTKNQPDL